MQIFRTCDMCAGCNARYEVLAAVLMKIAVFKDVMPCRLLNTDRHLGHTWCLHLQGPVVQWESYEEETARFSETSITNDQSQEYNNLEELNIQ